MEDEIRKLLHETAPQPSDPATFRLELNSRLAAVEQIKTYRDREYRRTRRLLRIVFSAGIFVGVAVARLVILCPFNLPDISDITLSDVPGGPYLRYILAAAGILTAAVAIVLPLTISRHNNSGFMGL